MYRRRQFHDDNIHDENVILLGDSATDNHVHSSLLDHQTGHSSGGYVQPPVAPLGGDPRVPEVHNRHSVHANVYGPRIESELTSLKSRVPCNNNHVIVHDTHVSDRNFLDNQLIRQGQGLTSAIEMSYHVQASRHSQSDFIYYNVQPGDTLQNLSVKYSCPISSIKRLNNLWSDQDFYGLARIKLPVGKFRMIADIIEPMEQLSPGQSKQELSQETFLEDHDHNIEKAKLAAKLYTDNHNAIMQTLAQSGGRVDDEDEITDPLEIGRRKAEILLNDMSDSGLSYSGLVLFIFIVCFVFPIAFVIYSEEKHHDTTNKAP